MRIRSVLLLGTAGMLLLIAAVAGLAYGSTAYANRVTAQRTTVVELEHRILDMNVLAQSYVLWHEARPREQWYVLYEGVAGLLADESLLQPPSDAYLPELRHGVAELKQVFDELTGRGGLGIADPAVERQVAGDLLVRSQRLATIADRMAEDALRARIVARAQSDSLMFALLAVLVLATGVAMTVIHRRVVGPVFRLREGAEIIGRGDLDFRTALGTDDELGDLSRAFDRMAEGLRGSRDELEQRIRERTEELERVSKRLEAMLESIGDAVIAIDREWNVTLWNPAAERLTGFSRADALGRPLRQVLRLLRVMDRSENVLFISDVLIDGRVRQMPGDTVVVRKDGAEVDVEDSAAPIIDERGRIVGAIIVIRDSTAEKDVERSRNDLVSLVTHELRGPASAIKGYLGLIRDEWWDKIPPEMREHLGLVAQSNDKLLELANSLLQVFRVDFGETVVQPEPADVREIGEEAVAHHAQAAAERGVRVEKEFGDVPVLNVDRKLVELAFANLLSNAIKYSREGGAVRVSVRQDDVDVVISVSDDGVGIPVTEQAKIFSKFYRASNVRALSGVGVGLHVLRAMLRRAGCRIWFESEEGRGTTFSVAIPQSGMANAGTRSST